METNVEDNLQSVALIFAAIESSKAGQPVKVQELLAKARQQAEAALAHVREALEAYARVAADQSDRGAIATMAEYVYRPLKEKTAQLREQ